MRTGLEFLKDIFAAFFSPKCALNSKYRLPDSYLKRDKGGKNNNFQNISVKHSYIMSKEEIFIKFLSDIYTCSARLRSLTGFSIFQGYI